MDIHNERREYLHSGAKGLHLDDLNANPIVQFKYWLEEAKQTDIKDPTAMMLATVDSLGCPSQRTVLLKAFNDQGFNFFTNLSSNKAQQIQHNDNVSLIFPWLTLERQVIISGKAVKLSIKENAEYFLSRPRDSQLAAWVSNQSSAISSKQLLLAKFEEISQRFANKDISLPEFWGGYRVEPTRIEFWSGSAKRLHDRFEYLKIDGKWTIQRLQP